MKIAAIHLARAIGYPGSQVVHCNVFPLAILLRTGICPQTQKPRADDCFTNVVSQGSVVVMHSLFCVFARPGRGGGVELDYLIICTLGLVFGPLNSKIIIMFVTFGIHVHSLFVVAYITYKLLLQHIDAVTQITLHCIHYIHMLFVVRCYIHCYT